MRLLTHSIAFLLGILAFIGSSYRWLDNHV